MVSGRDDFKLADNEVILHGGQGCQHSPTCFLCPLPDCRWTHVANTSRRVVIAATVVTEWLNKQERQNEK